MTPDDREPLVERLFDGLEVPAPPPHLRARVLEAARADKTETVDVWTRIWNIRGLRLAWAASVLLLLAGHVLVVPRNGAALSTVDPILVAENRVDEQFVDMLRPARISDHVQPVVGFFASSGGLAELDLEGNPS